MAENEYLDSTKARRWLSVADGILEGCDLDELADRIEKCLCKTLRIVGQDIPLADLIANVSDPAKLSQLCQSVEGASDVKSLLLDAAQNNDNPVAAVQQFLNSCLENCLYDIPYLAAERSRDINISEVRRRLDEVKMQLASDFRGMAEKWTGNPSWKPQLKRSRSATDKTVVDVTKSLLTESLIAGFRR